MLELLKLARAQISAGELFKALADCGDDLGARGAGQQTQLLEGLVQLPQAGPAPDFYADQDRPFGRWRRGYRGSSY